QRRNNPGGKRAPRILTFRFPCWLQQAPGTLGRTARSPTTMALTYSHSANAPRIARLAGGAYAWFGFVVMWAFWISFVVFLANPRWAAKQWHLPTIDGTSDAVHPAIAAAIDLALISLFGLQHSVMARPWFKSAVMGRLPDAFQRCTY